MKNILWFREISKRDIGTVGGKGANLGEIANEGFPVPPGFVVTAQAYFNFLETTGIKEKILKIIEPIDVENTEELEKAAGEVREIILGAPMGKQLEGEIKESYSKLGQRQLAFVSTREEEYVAVRSSATAEDLPEASFAGQQETFLNVRGRQEVVNAVKKCWASLFTARAVYYRKKNNFPTEKVGIAAVVQKMIDSEASGVMFTADPASGDTKKIVIEAGYGLGEAIVSGSITPDTYFIDKGSAKILDKRISEQEWMIVRGEGGNEKKDVSAAKKAKQKIDDKKIIALAKIGKQIENHYGKPQDIEFAIQKEQLFITQSRPITTLIQKQKITDERKIEEKMEKAGTREPIIKGLAASPGIVQGKAKVIEDIEQIEEVKKGDILVTKMTAPDWVPTMQKCIGIITNEGGSTCHAAIVSRELGIPCIVGTGHATNVLKTGETITVDGFKGVVYRGAIELEKPAELKEEEKKKIIETREEEEELVEEFEEEGEKIEEEKEEGIEKHLVELLEERAIKVKVNVALPEAAQDAAETNADGVGLLRAEHMITASGIHPAEFLREGKQRELIEAVKTGIRVVALKFIGKPVWYRTFDARTDEFRHLKGGEKEPQEENPMLGWHGIRRSLDEPELIKAEFTAIKELVAEGLNNIGIMLPFVQSAEEVRKAKELAVEVGLKPHKDIEFGIMVETPAAVWTIEEIIEEGIDFVSFGTNDLTQLTLGIDRNNEHIQKLFSEMHPAILRQCAYVIKKCKEAKVKTSICGQAGSNEEMVKKLIEFGIDSVSANIDAVEKIRKVTLLEEKRIILEKIQKEKK